VHSPLDAALSIRRPKPDEERDTRHFNFNGVTTYFIWDGWSLLAESK
jgi:hypothetical protein